MKEPDPHGPIGLTFGAEEHAFDPNRVHPAYQAVIRAWLDFGVEFVIIGGVAMALLWGERVTRDLDAVIRDLRAAIQALYQTGFCVVSRPVPSEPGLFAVVETSDAALAALEQRPPLAFRTVHRDAGVTIDLWAKPPADLSFDDLIAEGERVLLADLPILRASVGHLLRMKRHSATSAPSRAARDLQDIEFLERLLAR